MVEEEMKLKDSFSERAILLVFILSVFLYGSQVLGKEADENTTVTCIQRM
jgi:hypothetical protein